MTKSNARWPFHGSYSWSNVVLYYPQQYPSTFARPLNRFGVSVKCTHVHRTHATSVTHKRKHLSFPQGYSARTDCYYWNEIPGKFWWEMFVDNIIRCRRGNLEFLLEKIREVIRETSLLFIRLERRCWWALDGCRRCVGIYTRSLSRHILNCSSSRRKWQFAGDKPLRFYSRIHSWNKLKETSGYYGVQPSAARNFYDFREYF